MKTLLAALLLAPTLAFAQIPDANGTYTGCYLKATGFLRVINARQICLPAEVRITWNQKGQPGTPGGAGSGLVWKDSAGNVIAPHIPISGPVNSMEGADSLYVDDAGNFWLFALDQAQGTPRIVPIGWWTYWQFTELDCGGERFVQNAPILSRWVFPIGIWATPNYRVLNDAAVRVPRIARSQVNPNSGACENIDYGGYTPVAYPVFLESDTREVPKPVLPPTQGLLHLERQ